MRRQWAGKKIQVALYKQKTVETVEITPTNSDTRITLSVTTLIRPHIKKRKT